MLYVHADAKESPGCAFSKSTAHNPFHMQAVTEGYNPLKRRHLTKDCQRPMPPSI